MAAESLEDALKQLYLIDAIDENGSITRIGKTMAGTTLNYFYLISSFCAYEVIQVHSYNVFMIMVTAESCNLDVCIL